MKIKNTKFSGLGLYRLVERYSIALLVFSILLTVISFYLSTKIEFRSSYFELMPDDWPSIRDLNTFKQEFSGFGQIIPVIETDNLDKAKAFVRDFSRELKKLPEVEYVEYRSPYEFIKKYKYLYVDKKDLETVKTRIDKYIEDSRRTYVPVSFLDEDEAEKIEKPDFSDIMEKYSAVGGMDEYFVSTDKRFLAMIIQPKSSSLSISENKELLGKIDLVAKNMNAASYDPSIIIGYTGGPPKQIDSKAHLVRQIQKCSLIGTFLIIVMLAFYFRKASLVFLVGITLSAGTLWAYGLTYVFLGHVNIITGFAISIIIGLAGDYYIHMLNQYLKLRRSGKDVVEAFHYVFFSTNKANLIACGTTIGAVICLIISQFKGFSELAIVCSLGLLCNYFASNVFLIPALVLMEKIKFLRVVPDEK